MNRYFPPSKSTGKPGKGIKKKLQAYMETVTIDLFGYEKIVNKSVRTYAEKIANEQGVNAKQVYVRIIKPAELRVFLHVSGKLLKELTIRELVHFFVGPGALKSSHTESKVVSSVSKFFSDYSKKKHFDVDKVQVLISSNAEGALVKSFYEQSFIEEIPVKFLIKYFKA